MRKLRQSREASYPRSHSRQVAGQGLGSQPAAWPQSLCLIAPPGGPDAVTPLGNLSVFSRLPPPPSPCLPPSLWPIGKSKAEMWLPGWRSFSSSLALSLPSPISCQGLQPGVPQTICHGSRLLRRKLTGRLLWEMKSLAVSPIPSSRGAKWSHGTFGWGLSKHSLWPAQRQTLGSGGQGLNGCVENLRWWMVEIKLL